MVAVRSWLAHHPFGYSTKVVQPDLAADWYSIWYRPFRCPRSGTVPHMASLPARFDAQCPACGGTVRRGEMITSWTDSDRNKVWVHTEQCADAVGAVISARIRATYLENLSSARAERLGLVNREK
jgi:hypothetical protein